MGTIKGTYKVLPAKDYHIECLDNYSFKICSSHSWKSSIKWEVVFTDLHKAVLEFKDDTNFRHVTNFLL